MLIHNNFKKIIKKMIVTTTTVFLVWPAVVFADVDPATRTAGKMQNILFGTLGTSLCSILIGATFIMAKTGKITWDRFMYIGFCTAGFLGSKSIVNLISEWVT